MLLLQSDDNSILKGIVLGIIHDIESSSHEIATLYNCSYEKDREDIAPTIA